MEQIKKFIEKNKQKQSKEKVLSKTIIIKNKDVYKKFKCEKLIK